jgi:1-acylglycerone phosphate reductase
VSHFLYLSGIYQATKAALSQASDVWRLELEPLGVRVLNLLTGGIKSEFVNNLPTLPYPEDSYYATIKDIVPSEMDQSSLYMKPDVFAQDIVRHVERGATGKLWVGGGAGMMRTALWLLPEPVLVSFRIAM